MKKLLIILMLLFCLSGLSAAEQVEMRIVTCPEQNFATLCRPDYTYSYHPDEGVTVYLGDENSDSTVTLMKTDVPGADFNAEGYLNNGFVSELNSRYGERLLALNDVTVFSLVGKELPGRMAFYASPAGEMRMLLCAYDLEDTYFVRCSVSCPQTDSKIADALTALAVVIGNLKPDADAYSTAARAEEPSGSGNPTAVSSSADSGADSVSSGRSHTAFPNSNVGADSVSITAGTDAVSSGRSHTAFPDANVGPDSVSTIAGTDAVSSGRSHTAFPDANVGADSIGSIAGTDAVSSGRSHTAFPDSNVGADSVSTTAGAEALVTNPGRDELPPVSADNQSEQSSTEPEGNPEAQAPVIGVSLEQARYSFEHRMLPGLFYEDPSLFIQSIISLDFYQVWESVAAENGVPITYAPDDFARQVYTSESGMVLVQIDMPKPEATPQCYRLYFLYNESSGFSGYYTVEYDEMLSGTAFVCAWTADHEHMEYGTIAVCEKGSPDYAGALSEEAALILSVTGDEPAAASTEDPAGQSENLETISCPEQGFTFLADKTFSWDYEAATGITVYTETKGSIPYIIVYEGDSRIEEPFEYIHERYTPYMQETYGTNLIGFEEVEHYSLGGRTMAAGIYHYSLQGYTVEMIRAYDSSGSRTVAYTAKYIEGRGQETLEALQTAAESFESIQ